MNAIRLYSVNYVVYLLNSWYSVWQHL